MNNEDTFWTPYESGNVIREAPPAYGVAKPVFDLEERTARFGEAVIRFLKTVPHGPLTNRLIDLFAGMTKPEWRMRNEIRMSQCPKVGDSNFVIDSAFLILVSSFLILP